MDPVETYPLDLDLTHKWDDEADTKIKRSIHCFLTQSTTISAQEVANEIASSFQPEHNIGGFRDGVEDICIYTSRYLPANHISQDRLIEIIKALRELPQQEQQPQWRYIFQTGSYLLIEAEGKKAMNRPTSKPLLTDSSWKTGAQDLYHLHIDTPENAVKRAHLRNLHAFMARLTRDGISICFYQALHAFSQALETAEPYITTRTMDVLIVYDWLRLAGSKLMEAELKGSPGCGELWDKQKPGFSQERWEFWRRRLEDIEKDAGYEDQARETAGKAKDVLVQLMEG